MGSILTVTDSQISTIPQVNPPNNPPNAPQLDAEHTELDVPTVGPDVTPSPAAEAIEDEVLSDTLTLPETFDIGMDDSAPPAANQGMIIDHSTDETTVNNNEQPPLPLDAATTLVDIPPETLLADRDVRPQWLITAIKKFLLYVPYFGNLGKVVDLWLAQEARLGYPQLVCAFSCFETPSLTAQPKSVRLALPSSNRPTEVAAFMKWARDYSRGDNVDAGQFGTAVLQWWLTIQPTSRKSWPPVYNNLPGDTSFDYFNRGGPNGAFLMILCLGWWASALDEGMDCTNFNLVVDDVGWVLEQVASKA